MSVVYSLLLIGATFGWGYLFYKQDFHPQPPEKIIQIFTIGSFSVLPVFAYQHIYQQYLPLLSENHIFQPLLDSPFISGFFFFLVNLVLLSVVLLALTSLLTLALTFFKHETLENIKNSLKRDELEFVTVSMMIGLLVYGENFLERIIGMPILNTLLGTILFLTIIEEYVKHLVVRFVDDKALRDIDDAITLSVMVGLAFGMMETLFYALKGMDLSLMIYRAMLSMPVHVVASGIFGYYYGKAHFAKKMLAHEPKKHRPLLHIKWLRKVLTLNRKTVYEEEQMVEGIAFACLFHGSMNVLFELNLAFLTVPFIMGGLWTLGYFYRRSHIFYRWLHG